MKLNLTASLLYKFVDFGSLKPDSDRIFINSARGVEFSSHRVTGCERSPYHADIILVRLQDFGSLSLNESDTVSLLINE